MVTIEDLQYALPGMNNALALNVGQDTTLGVPCRCLFVGNTGNLKVDTAGGNTGITFVNVQNGAYVNVRAIKVYASGTTCNNVVALW